jgi:hypothetical protein
MKYQPSFPKFLWREYCEAFEVSCQENTLQDGSVGLFLAGRLFFISCIICFPVISFFLYKEWRRERRPYNELFIEKL